MHGSVSQSRTPQRHSITNLKFGSCSVVRSYREGRLWRITLLVPISTSRAKILVVDDDPVILEIVREILERAGYHVDTRDQALGTAQWVLREQPDYVLLDVKMPALSGGELAQLLARKETKSGAAVVLHSSTDVDDLAALAHSTGALGAIKKNPNAMLFLAEFERLIAQHRHH